MNVKTSNLWSLKTPTQNEIMLLPSLKSVRFFKEKLSLKTFDANHRFRLHPSRTQGLLKEPFL